MHMLCPHSETINLLQHLYQLIIILSAPAIHIIWTEPLPPYLCFVISAHHSPISENCTHRLRCEWFLHLGIHGIFIYLILQSAAAC